MRWALIVILASTLTLQVSSGDDASSISGRECLRRILEEDVAHLDAAAEGLQGPEGAQILEEIRDACQRIHDKSRRRVLAYLLAWHGEREGFCALIEMLGHRRDATWLRLRRAAIANPDAGHLHVSPERWWEWLGRISDRELADRDVRSFWSPLRLENPAWDDCLAGLRALQEQGDRARAALIFRRFADAHPRSRHAGWAGELADVLTAMAEEDRRWVDPTGLEALSAENRVQWLVYHLRDVVDFQQSQPAGRAVVLRGHLESQASGSVANPASELAMLGRRAVPALIALLEDRRVTRAVGYARRNQEYRVVLRYQDAAIEILSRIMMFRPYAPATASMYFSRESVHERSRVAERVRQWAAATDGKSAAECLLIGVRMAETRDALALLRRLDLDHGRRERALAECRRLYGTRRSWRPEICELMCEMGDCSFLREVLRGEVALDSDPGQVLGRNTVHTARRANAQETIRRLRERFAHRVDGRR